MSALVISRLSLKEAVSRRLVVSGLVLSGAFVGLFAFGFSALYGRVEAADDVPATMTVLAATIQTVLGIYAVNFLAAFLAMFLSVGAVSSEIDSGLVHAVLARPVARWSWLLQRWLAFAAIAVGYVVVMAGALLVVARVVAGYGALDPWRAFGLLALEVLALLSLGLLASTRWSTLTSGVVVFALFGLGWLAGIIEFVGTMVNNDAMRTIGIAVSLVVPSDALWRGASYYLQSPAFLVTETQGGIPFASVTPPSGRLVAWSLVYVAMLLLAAVLTLRRRDL